MIINIPQDRRRDWRGIFSSKMDGDFQQTFNMDLERVPGKMSLSGMYNIDVGS